MTLLDGRAAFATTRWGLVRAAGAQDPAGRTRLETDLSEWIGKRAGTGRMAPRGFPRDNRFT